MPYFIYSSESLPNPALIGKPGYTPDGECVMHGGWRLPQIPERQWMKLDNFITLVKHSSWLDKRGTPERVYMEDIAPAIRNKWSKRGVVLLDHEPTPEEKKKYENESNDLFLAHLMGVIEDYEERLKQKAVGEKVATRVTPYEDMAYELLGVTKPYSVEAMRAQRHPGESVGEQIVAALERLEKRREEAKSEKNSHKPAPATA